MSKIYNEITIITVLFNSSEIVESFFDSLKNFKIIVVGDNLKINKIKNYGLEEVDFEELTNLKQLSEILLEKKNNINKELSKVKKNFLDIGSAIS